jgi:hypothetical protein
MIKPNRNEIMAAATIPRQATWTKRGVKKAESLGAFGFFT